MRDFLFIHIPKNAGQSMQQVLKPHDRCKHREYTTKACVYFNRMSADEFRSVFSFAFVRNPWDRQVSFYEFIRKTPTHSLHKDTVGLSFYEYIHTIFPYHPVVFEYQKGYTHSCDKQLVNFVGRFENIEEDFDFVCSKIGLKLQLPKINTTPHGHYREYYCEETQRMVGDAFIDDITTFGYDF